jgi:hypothetical protein
LDAFININGGGGGGVIEANTQILATDSQLSGETTIQLRYSTTAMAVNTYYSGRYGSIKGHLTKESRAKLVRWDGFGSKTVATWAHTLLDESMRLSPVASVHIQC